MDEFTSARSWPADRHASINDGHEFRCALSLERGFALHPLSVHATIQTETYVSLWCHLIAIARAAFSHGCLRWNGRVAPANHAARKLACQVQQITNEDIAKNAWVSPGWRGAYVSSQPESTQTALVAGVTLLGALLTYFTYTTAGPWVCNNVPLMDTYMTKAPFIQGPLIAAAGVAHFYPLHEEFCSFYPHRGAWGFWYASSFPDIQPYIARTAQAVRAALGVFALASGQHTSPPPVITTPHATHGHVPHQPVHLHRAFRMSARIWTSVSARGGHSRQH